MSSDTNCADGLGVGNIVDNDLAHLGEVPAVPLLDTHGVRVELLVKVVEKGDGLDNHGVDLVGAELELVTRERVGQTEDHCAHLALGQACK